MLPPSGEVLMNRNDPDNLHFITDENEEIFIDSFVMERSANVVMAGYGFEESEDETIANSLIQTLTASPGIWSARACWCAMPATVPSPPRAWMPTLIHR